MRRRRLKMPGESVITNQGRGAHQASRPLFLPHCWLRMLWKAKIHKWAMKAQNHKSAEGKIKAMPHRHRYLIVCTSFFGEAPVSLGEALFCEVLDLAAFDPEIMRLEGVWLVCSTWIARQSSSHGLRFYHV